MTDTATLARAALVLAAAAAGLAVAAPAAAHPTLDVASIGAETRVEVAVRVPVEGDGGNDTVSVQVGDGLEVDGCDAPERWTCGARPDGTGTIVEYVRGVGDATEDRFLLTLVAPAAHGDRALPVTQTTGDGDEVVWDDDADGPHPAPVLTVAAATVAAGVQTHAGDEPEVVIIEDPAAAFDVPTDPTPAAGPTSADAPAAADRLLWWQSVLIVSLGLLPIAAGAVQGRREARRRRDAELAAASLAPETD